jgi:hypothetical protein
MTSYDAVANAVDQLLANICERALQRQDYETARDANHAIRLRGRALEIRQPREVTD